MFADLSGPSAAVVVGIAGKPAAILTRSDLLEFLVAPPRSPSGFDCSGLVAYVYGKLGVRLPHNAAAQFAFGRPVSRGNLRPGDLVFFHGLGHVGLYIGRGRIIHAPQSGERVEIQSLAVRSGSVEGVRRLVRA